MSSEVKFDYKVIVLGDGRVGKSSLINRLVTNTYPWPFETGSFIEMNKIMTIDKKFVKLAIVDSFNPSTEVTKIYCHDCKGAIIMYDVTNKKSFTNVSKWLRFAQQNCAPGAVIMVVGAKADEENPRQVAAEEGGWFAQTQKCPFKEVSSKDQLNVDECFSEVITGIMKKKM